MLYSVESVNKANYTTVPNSRRENDGLEALPCCQNA